MEQISLWVTVIGIIIIPIAGWIINATIKNLKDDIATVQAQQKEDRALWFKRFDEEKSHTEAQLEKEKIRVDDEFVRLALYEQSTRHQRENSEAAIKSLMHIMNTQFTSIESKLEEMTKKIEGRTDDIKELEKKIDSLREVIVQRNVNHKQ